MEVFARQLSLPRQQRLFDYWLSLRRGEGWPARRDIRCRDLWELLPNLLLMQVRPLPEGVRVRLAGSDLWDIYGGELTGRTLNDDCWGAHADYWREVYADSAQAPRPANGHLLLNQGEEAAARGVLFWMRLPLVDEDGGLWLLGLDVLEPASQWNDLAPADSIGSNRDSVA